jgi:hypothetical protein
MLFLPNSVEIPLKFFSQNASRPTPEPVGPFGGSRVLALLARSAALVLKQLIRVATCPIFSEDSFAGALPHCI